jgi:16S rRNA (adenine1518-N6/adenine1519-N6)-dimethyltransferase
LHEYVIDWERLAHALNIDPRVRAEELSLSQWILLTNSIAPPTPADESRGADEQFPVVDKNDRILRSASRSEVHGNNLLHRAVHILLFNEAGEVYLQQRSRSKDRHPLKWDSSVAGHVTAGETYDETAQRELNEELGVSVPLRSVAKLSASERTDHEFIWLYDGAASGALVPNSAEIEQGAFVPTSAVNGWTSARPEDFAPAFLECWKAHRRKTCPDSPA